MYALILIGIHNKCTTNWATNLRTLLVIINSSSYQLEWLNYTKIIINEIHQSLLIAVCILINFHEMLVNKSSALSYSTTCRMKRQNWESFLSRRRCVKSTSERERLSKRARKCVKENWLVSGDFETLWIAKIWNKNQFATWLLSDRLLMINLKPCNKIIVVSRVVWGNNKKSEKNCILLKNW